MPQEVPSGLADDQVLINGPGNPPALPWLMQHPCPNLGRDDSKENAMSGLIYLVGLVVVVMAVLSLIGLR